MPSFDAPIRLEPAASRQLAWWSAACDGGAVLATAGLLATWSPAMSNAWLAISAAGVLGAVIWGHLRGGGCAAADRIELASDGSLRAMLASGETFHGSGASLTRLGPFLSLHGHRYAGGRRRSVRFFFAADGLDRNVWRRCCAWTRAGLPKCPAVPASPAR